MKQNPKFSGKTELTVLNHEDGVPIYHTSPNAIEYSQPWNKKIIVEEIKGVHEVLLLHNVLSPEECHQFITLTEDMGYEIARLTTGYGMVENTNIRNNKRVMWQSTEDVWTPIWNRIKDSIPPTTEHYKKIWRAYGLNERLRFYRYQKGEQFRPHYDGCFPRNYHDKSFLTFIIYLNDNFSGGTTTFYDKHPVSVKPKQGSALIFWHGHHSLSPLHEGAILEDGEKYVLRSDVMFKV